MNEKPIVFDIYCGLGGWSEAFIAEGYRTIGFDIEAHDYGRGGYPGELIIIDARKISGAELVKVYGMPACIVASPPCQEFSYMAMPWSKAKPQLWQNPTSISALDCQNIQAEAIGGLTCVGTHPNPIRCVGNARTWQRPQEQALQPCNLI